MTTNEIDAPWIDTNDVSNDLVKIELLELDQHSTEGGPGGIVVDGTPFVTRGDVNPCSNDGEFSKGTQPCPGAVNVFEGLDFETSGSVDNTESSEYTDSGDNEDEGGDTSEAGGGSNNGGDGGDDVANIQDGTTDGANNNEGTSNTNSNGSDAVVIDGVSYPSFYSCTATEEELISSSNSNGGGNDELPISFNYEVYTSPSGTNNLETILGNFERQLANGVASSLGLVDCADNIDTEVAVEVALRMGGGGRHRQLGMRRSLHNHNNMIEEESSRSLDSSSIVGVSMNPVDKVDTDIVCSSSATLGTDIDAVCSPIIGIMTAYITSSQRRHLRQLAGDSNEDQETTLLNTVQSYIEQNPDSYLNDDLLEVVYTGPRELEVAPVDSATEQVEMNSNHDSLPGVIAAVALVAVFAVVAVGVAIRRRRKSRIQAEHSGHLHDLDQQGAFPSGLTPESQSHHLSCSDAGDTQGALPPPEYSPQPDNGNLFGLSGARSDDDEEEDVEEGGTQKPPSSLAVMGTATSLVRELSYSPVNVDQDQEEEDSNTFDMAPVMSKEDDDNEHSVDIEPMSPTPNHNNVVDDESIGSADNSSVIYLDETENALPGQAVSPSESTVEARNTTSEMLDNAPPTISDETSEDDEDGMMV